MFSFNNPYGACPSCTGLGTQLRVDPDLIMPEPDSSRIHRRRHRGVRLGQCPRRHDSIAQCILNALAEKIPFHVLIRPSATCPKRRAKLILYGTGGEKLTLALRISSAARQRSTQPVRGHRGQPRAPLSRNAEPCHARGDRAVHVRNALPGLRRPPSPQGSACRHGRRHEYLASSAICP